MVLVKGSTEEIAFLDIDLSDQAIESRLLVQAFESVGMLINNFVGFIHQKQVSVEGLKVPEVLGFSDSQVVLATNVQVGVLLVLVSHSLI